MNELYSESESDSDIGDAIDDNELLEDILQEVEVVREIDLEQSARDRELPTDIASGWGNVDSPPVLMDFSGVSGLTCDIPDERTPLNMFNILFDEDMWVTMTVQTNNYAQNKLRIAREDNNLKPNARILKWTDTTVDEMKIFMSIVIVMGIVKKPCLEDYWSTSECIATPHIDNTMSKDRFMIILSNLHLVFICM